MRRKLKIKVFGNANTLNKFVEIYERKYTAGFIPTEWSIVSVLFNPTQISLNKNVRKYIREYYQIRRMCDGHYIVYRRYYFFKWWYYAIDDHINKIFGSEKEAKDAIIKSLIRK